MQSRSYYQKLILEHLNENFRDVTNLDVWDLSDVLEDVMPRIFCEFYFKFLSKEILGFKIQDSNKGLFFYDYNLYNISVVPEPLNPSKLVVCIRHTDFYANKPSKKSFHIVGHGKIKNIVFLFPKQFSAHLEMSVQFLQTLGETIYNWFYLQLKRSIDDQAIVSNSLADQLQLFFGKRNEVICNLWFFAIYKGKGFYILSKDNMTYALMRMDEVVKIKNESAIRLFSEILKLVLPYEKTLSLFPLTQNTPVDFINWADQAKYSEEKYLLIKGEKLIFTDDITIYPVYNGDRIKLVAMTPTCYRSIVEPIIEQNRDELSQIIKIQFNKVQKILSNITHVSNDLNWSQIGEFVGGFIKGFVSQ